MSKVNKKTAMMEEIKKCSESLIFISEQMCSVANAMKEMLEELKEESEKSVPEQEPAKEMALTLTEVRKILADKSRAGFTAEIKKLLIKHGAEKLSEIAPTEYVALVADVEVLGNG